MKSIENIREKIDSIDKQLVELFEERFALSRAVAENKIGTGQKVLDKQREKEKIEGMEVLIKDMQDKPLVEEIFGQIMDLSRKVQYGLIIEKMPEDTGFIECEYIEKDGKKAVYQGVPGAYSQEAMLSFFGDDIENFGVNLWREAMEALNCGDADYAVVPIENSSAGIVSEIFDLLVEFECCIVEEINVKVAHSLMGIKGTKISDIKTVYTHPQAFAQCGEFLNNHKDWECIPLNNTAYSALKVSRENDKTQAAIGSPLAAQIYDLDILEEGINASEINTTRFFVVSREKKFKKNAKKIMVSFELPHESGSLYRMLSHFIFNRLNMTKIESRPIPSRKWEYRFFVEFEGNFNEHDSLTALKGISEEALSIKLMGNY